MSDINQNQDPGEELNNINQVVLNEVKVELDRAPVNFKYEERTLLEWSKYFDVPINDVEEFRDMMDKQKYVSDLLDECSNMLSLIRASYQSLGYKEFLTTKYNQNRINGTPNAREKRAKEANFQAIGATKAAEILVDFFQQQLFKLKDKSRNLETLITAKVSEMKYLTGLKSGF